jgi:hypothetical protein
MEALIGLVIELEFIRKNELFLVITFELSNVIGMDTERKMFRLISALSVAE